MDNTAGLTKQITRTATGLLIMYLMIMGFMRVRNESIVNSAKVFVEERGVFSNYDVMKTIQVNETCEVLFNLTIQSNIENNETKVVVNLFKWNSSRYDKWIEAREAWIVTGDAPLELIPKNGSIQATQHQTIKTITLTQGTWTLQLIPIALPSTPYRVTLVEIP